MNNKMEHSNIINTILYFFNIKYNNMMTLE